MRLSFAALVLLAGALPLAGCSEAGAGADASADYVGVQPGPDATGDDSGGDASGEVSTALRLANMSPDLGPVDFCWRVSGATSFTGPVLGERPADAGAAVDGGGVDATLEGGAEATADAGADAIAEGGDDGATDAAAEATGDAGLSLDASADAAEAGSAGADAGATAQVAFGAMSARVYLPASGTFDLALVAADQLSCEAPRFIGRVTLDAGKSATVAILGQVAVDGGSASALHLTAFVDELPEATSAKVRVIHAALGAAHTPPAPALSVTAGEGVVLAPEVDPGEATLPSTSPPVDSLGYLDAASVPGVAAVQLDSMGDAQPHTWTTPFVDLGARAGTVHTGFVVNLQGGALGLAWCGDLSSRALPPSCRLFLAR